MNESTKGSAEGLLEAWRQRMTAFRINPDQLSYIDNGKVVASGGFGQVKKAVFTGRTRDRGSAVPSTGPRPNPKTRGITVAVKTLQIHVEVDQERLEKRFMREAYVWSQLKNDHIIDFLGFYFSCSEGKTEALLVCPWMENGQSVNYVKQQRLRPVERLHLLLDAAKGLKYLHSRVPPICHGDIKGSNVLIKYDGRAALCDFGLAQVLDEEFERLASQTIHRGTIRWTSPERLDDNGPLTPSSDVWSWAWLIWEFMTEKIPFHRVNNASAVIFHIVTLKFPAYEQDAAISEVPTLSKLMQLCWQREPESRLDMEECIERLEQILEGFEPHDAAGKNQAMLIGSSSFFQPAASPSFPPGPPPAAHFGPSGRMFEQPEPTVIVPPSPPGGSFPTAAAIQGRPPRPAKPRKDLPPIPGQDGEIHFLTAPDPSHEQRKDLESSWEPKPRPANAPENPPSAFNFKGLRSFKPSKTSSSESSTRAAGIGLKNLKNRLLPSSKRKAQQRNYYDGDEWDWDIIPPQSSLENNGSNQYPSYPTNSDVTDLRHKVDYIMRTLQRMELTQGQHSQRQQDITNYLSQVNWWFSGAPVFGSPYLSGPPPPTIIPTGQPFTMAQPPGQAIPFIPPGYVTGPSFIAPYPTGTPGQPIIIQQPQPMFVQLDAYRPSSPSSSVDLKRRLGQAIIIQPPQPQPQVVHVSSPRYSPSSSVVSSPASLLASVDSGPRPFIPPQDPSHPVPSTSRHPRASAYSVERIYLGGVYVGGVDPPAIRQFEHNEIGLHPENGFEGREQVQRGVILETRTTIAIKPVDFHLESGTQASERALMSELHKWLRRWGSLEHENITKVLGSAFVNEVPSVITEWCTDGNVAQYLEKTPQADRRSLLRQVAQGLNYLHTASHRMIHSNLKPNNVLIDDGKVKLADIGILKFLETRDVGAEMHGRAGDARWTAPEVLEGRDHRWRSDVYSFGCLALFILRDELPYAALKNDVAVSKAIYRGDLPISREAASALHPTWKLCWAQDPQRRPRMSTVLESLESW